MRVVCPTGATRGERLIDPADLDVVRDAIYPMLPVPLGWQRLEGGAPALNWVAGLALSRLGR